MGVEVGDFGSRSWGFHICVAAQQELQLWQGLLDVQRI